MPTRVTWTFLLACTPALAAGPSLAQTGADFYKGKTVTYIVATAPGGGYDLYGRLVADYMQKYLPGSTFVVKNMPGAGHLVGANAIYASPPDGLTIGTFNTGLIYNQLIKKEGVRFDLTKMSWIGKAASDPRVVIVAQQTPIKSYKELVESKQTLNFATAGIGSAAFVETTMLINTLNWPAKILTGYDGNSDQLAMRRGEIHGSIASRSSWDEFVKNGYGRYVAQIGGKDKDVPQLASLVSDPEAKELIALIQSQGDISRLTAGPPGIPQDRLDALRTAYRKALEDKELQAKAEKAGRPIDPAYGDEVLKMVKQALNQKEKTVALLKQALEQEEPPPPETKGTISELKNGNREITLKLPDGKVFEAKISGSRTELTVGGKKAKRDELKTGMSCTVAAPKSGAEARSIACN
ncbi:MAG TPA: tripartite tricarboxylate transporter substrate-binding protein [Hyphomicrobiaceae bacterium]|nr:tripartite tricarboxylate transporter substrate-binding protein [Hyphomicrobiaceae bacterium]